MRTSSASRGTAVAVFLVGTLLAAPGLAVTYDDATIAAGVTFQTAGELHFTETPWPAFPEIMGGGACFFDYDGDGYPDLFFVNARYNDENPAFTEWHDDADPQDTLYHNNGDGTFTDVTVDAGMHEHDWGYGCSAADYDGDQDIDLFVSNFGPSTLWRNNGDGTFTDVSEASGADMEGACGAWVCFSTSSGWADYDRDGDLDLYVANYVDSAADDLTRGPQNHLAQKNFLLRNNGDGTFTNVAQDAGVAGVHGDDFGSKSLGVVWYDHDNDGDQDLYVANDQVPNDLYQNDGDGSFTEISNESGTGDPRAGMGVMSGDYDDDGFLDLFMTHYRGQENGFYRNRGDGTYQDRSGEDALTASLWNVGWGAAFVDIDLDGDLDMVLVNGHTDWTSDAYDDNGYNQTAQIFRNDPEPIPSGPGDRLWVDVSEESGPAISERRVWRGAAFADWDLDGDVDAAFVPNANQSAMMVRAEGVPANHFLRLELRQPGANGQAIGARVELTTPERVQHREVQAGSSYLSQNDVAITFGLGAHALADRLTVRWPGGGVTELLNVTGDRVVRLDRATGLLEDDTIAPITTVLSDIPGSAGWWNDTVTIRFETQERGVTRESGLASVLYRFDEAAWAPYTGESFTFPDEGRHVLNVQGADLAGNVEPLLHRTIGVDRTDPTPKHFLFGFKGDAGWWRGSVRVRLDMDDPLSGPGTITYSVDGGAPQTYTERFWVRGDGVHTVDYTVRDRAGNSVIRSFTLPIDTTPPDPLFVTPRNGVVYYDGAAVAEPGAGPAVVVVDPLSLEDFEVLGVATDALSGVATMRLHIDGEFAATAAGSALTFLWDVLNVDVGTHVMQLDALDVAGNRAIRQGTVLLVRGPPPPGVPSFDPYPPALFAEDAG